MQNLRSEQFVFTLQQLGQKYPEYASFVESVIQLFKQRQAERMDAAVKRFRSEDW